MKVLMVNKFLYPRGGAETYFLKIGDLLEKWGHQVEYFGMADERNIVGNSLNLSVRNKDFHNAGLEKYLYPFQIIYSLEAKCKIRRVIREFKPDIIHLNNINFQLTPSIIDAAAAEKVPMVQTVHDLQMLCPNHLMLDVNKMKPCELCMHGTMWNCVKGNCIHGSKLKSIIGSIEGILYRYIKTYDKVTTYICPSEFIEKKLLNRTRYKGKTQMLRNFLGEIPKDSAQEKKNYVLFFGRLSQEKGIDEFVKACAMLPEIPFVIAGSGPLEEKCKNSGLKNVQYVGFQTGDALKKLVQEALFSVHFSIWYENAPLAILESQALGTPVLCNRIGGIPELVDENETGILNDIFTAESYAEQIRKLYNDREKLKQFAANCLNKKNTMMTLEAYTERLLKIYNDVIERRG